MRVSRDEILVLIVSFHQREKLALRGRRQVCLRLVDEEHLRLLSASNLEGKTEQRLHTCAATAQRHRFVTSFVVDQRLTDRLSWLGRVSCDRDGFDLRER